jgi:hypothetical protein
MHEQWLQGSRETMAYGKIDSLKAAAVTLQVISPLKSSPPDSSCSCCFSDLLFFW